MTRTPAAETLIAHVKQGVALLEELHILAQTQTLFLDVGDLEGMTTVVEAKENLVVHLLATRSAVATCLEDGKSEWKELPELGPLKERAFYLLQRIAAVEAANQSQLETLRAQVIERSQKLQELGKLQKTYGTKV
jgi:hypothetical protein